MFTKRSDRIVSSAEDIVPPTRTAVKNATLYFHYPCFDGLVSGVLAWVFLEHAENWQIEQFCPVNYEIRDSWSSTQLNEPAAVVDFLYHPQATFWADHHLTTFRAKDAEREYETRKNQACLLFDERAPSCAGLLWRHLRSRMPNADRYQEMVSWAEKIDSASYASAQEAIWGDAPALRISATLILPDGTDYSRMLLRELRTGDLPRVAQLTAVSAKFDEVRRRLVAGLKKVEGHVKLQEGGIAIFDIEAENDELVSRYVPYHFFPDARYSVGVVRSAAGARITAMRNPWRDFESIPLGKIVEQFGGGGHQRVGSVAVPPERAGQVPLVVDRLVSEMRSQAPLERVTV